MRVNDGAVGGCRLNAMIGCKSLAFALGSATVGIVPSAIWSRWPILGRFRVGRVQLSKHGQPRDTTHLVMPVAAAPNSLGIRRFEIPYYSP
jgi:hypothetical protein